MKENIEKMFQGKEIAVTGGLGSIGSQIINKIMRFSPKKVLLLDNRETGLFYASEYSQNKRVQAFFCDIREKEQVKRILKNTDIVFHAAAMKHVIICEKNPSDAVKTNVIGTQNVIETCMDNEIEKMILISTDKAVNPKNVMGATKLLAERLVSAMCNVRKETDTKFGIVRFGNVLYSRGSVLEIWEKQLKKNQKITITDKEMTRFFMDISQSVDLIFNASYYAENGETFILKMPSVKIGVLAEAFLEVMGYPSNNYRIIGMRPGEKLHEELLLEDETGLLLENDSFFLRVYFLKMIRFFYGSLCN
ncbi:MAG: polysaccharide biosynthesis protein [Euryarchaeota archaeon]|nr:polysaccharide biosynthesis protein [Euryarchaeota archaeon]